MMKTLVVGDTHCLDGVFPAIDTVLSDTGAGRVILLGDYMDDWHAGTDDRITMARALRSWVSRTRGNGIIVTPLLGNHDILYFLGHGHPQAGRIGRMAPGYDRHALNAVHEEFSGIDGMRVATVITVRGTAWLCSHAGVTGGWAYRTLGPDMMGSGDAYGVARAVDDMDDWDALYMFGPGRGGHEPCASPLCADLTELVADPMPGIHQIVGHTPVGSPLRVAKADSDLLFLDTMSRTPDGVPIGDGMWLMADDAMTPRSSTMPDGMTVVDHEPVS